MKTILPMARNFVVSKVLPSVVAGGKNIVKASGRKLMKQIERGAKDVVNRKRTVKQVVQRAAKKQKVLIRKKVAEEVKKKMRGGVLKTRVKKARKRKVNRGFDVFDAK